MGPGEVAAAAQARGSRPARVQLKADTGLGRNGCQPATGPNSSRWGRPGARRAEGLLEITGLWSHFACADEPGHPSIASQLDVFHTMLEHAEKAGVSPRSGTSPTPRPP
ncbi:Alanine racemase OS=Streptomyces albaduncus OX=68172 GN=FHS32_000868 PE=3 SV=1 [Streptomyces griseoloalbus]